MNSVQLLLLTLSLIASIAFGDITHMSDDSHGVVDRYPNYQGMSPEKPLPNDNVYDSHEPRNIDGPDWKNTIKTVVSTAAVVQCVIVALYLCISRPCRISVARQVANGEYPSKWNDEQIYAASERRYLSNKDDAMPSDDFETDPEDLEMY